MLLCITFAFFLGAAFLLELWPFDLSTLRFSWLWTCLSFFSSFKTMLWTLCGFIGIMALHVAQYFGSLGFSWCWDRGRYSTSISMSVLSVTCIKKRNFMLLHETCHSPRMSPTNIEIINNTNHYDNVFFTKQIKQTNLGLDGLNWNQTRT